MIPETEAFDYTLWIYPFTLVEDNDCHITVTDMDGTERDIELMQDDDGNNAGYYNHEHLEADKLIIKDDKGMVKPYTLTLLGNQYTYTVVLEPAQGYKKLYAYFLSKAAVASQPGTTESTHDYIYLTAETLEESDGIAYDANGNPWKGTLRTVSTGLAYTKPYDAHSGGGSND